MCVCCVSVVLCTQPLTPDAGGSIVYVDVWSPSLLVTYPLVTPLVCYLSHTLGLISSLGQWTPDTCCISWTPAASLDSC